MSRLASARNRELMTLVLVAGVTVIGFTSVYIAREEKLSRLSLTYAAPFLVLYLLAHVVVRFRLPNADPHLLPIAALLTALGEIEIFRMYPTLARDQALWIAVGVALFTAVILVVRDLTALAELRYTFGAAAIVLLASPILVGTEVNGAQLWIRVAGRQIQPGEFAKVLFVIFLAAYLRDNREVLAHPARRVLGIGLPALRHALPLLVPWIVSLGLLVALNDLGTSLLVFGVFLGLVYIATGRPLYVGGGIVAFGAGAFLASRVAPQVGQRIDSWLDPWSQEATGGFQIAQSLYSIADGGIFGAGLGRGFVMAGKQTLIPYAETDFIFAVIATETGLVGASAVVLLYLLFAWRGFAAAARASDTFVKLLAAGLTLSLSFQAFVILGGVTKLIPLTGLTLPFVSYGGSSVVANFALLALLLIASHNARTPA